MAIEEENNRHEDHDSPKDELENGYKEEKDIHLKHSVEPIGGLHINKKTLWMVAGGAAGALAMLGLGKAFERARPLAVGALKEGYGFKEWIAGKLEAAREDMEDVMAEAVFNYHQDLAATAETVKREKEILERVERLVEERLARTSAEKKEG